MGKDRGTGTGWEGIGVRVGTGRRRGMGWDRDKGWLGARDMGTGWFGGRVSGGVRIEGLAGQDRVVGSRVGLDIDGLGIWGRVGLRGRGLVSTELRH